MSRIVWLIASVFSARAFGGEPAAAHALVSKALNAPEDLDAAPVQSAAARVQNAAVAVQSAGARVQNAAVAVQSAGARVQNAAVPDQNVAAPARTVVAQAQNVGAVDLTAARDHDAVAVHNAGAFPHVARALSGKVVAHNCAQVDPNVARGSRFAAGVLVAQIARGDPFLPAACSFPGVPAVQFVQADLFSRAAQDDPQGFRLPLPAVWWEQSMVVALLAPNRWC